MTFLTLDDKNECIGYYHSGELFFGQDPPKDLGSTWKYISALNKTDTLYANIYAGGKDFNEICPEDLKEEWDRLNAKAKAFIRSFIESKVSLKNNCFYDLVPEKFLIDYCDIKCRIIDHVIETYPKPIDYEFKSKLEILLTTIRSQKLSFNEMLNNFQLHEQKLYFYITKYEYITEKEKLLLKWKVKKLLKK